MNRFLKIASLLVLACFAASLFYRPIEVEDFWWHLATGRWIINHGQVPQQDFTPFESLPTPWVFTQWLGSSLFYLIYQISGFIGLKVFRVFIFWMIMLIWGLYSYRKVPFSIFLGLMLCLVFAFDMRANLRPDLFNYLFIQIFLIILLDYWQKEKIKGLWLIPFLGMLWNNLNVGSFFYGNLLLGIFIFCAFIEWFQQKINHGPLLAEAGRKCKYLISTILGYQIAFFVNPYGTEGFLYHWKVFLLPQHILFYQTLQTIGEMSPPKYLFSFYGIHYLIIILLGLILIYRERKQRFLYFILIGVPLFMFLYAQRSGSFFIIVVLYILVNHIECTGLKRRLESKRGQVLQNLFCLFFIVIVTASFLNRYNQKVVLNDQIKRNIKLEQMPEAPGRVIDWMKSLGIYGRVFAWESYGSYLMWFGYPEFRPFVDGRQLNKEFYFNLYYATLKSPERYWPQIDERFRFQIVLLDGGALSNLKIIRYINRLPDWQLLAVEGSCVVFVKKGIFNLPEELEHFSENLKNISVSQNELNELSSRRPFNWIDKLSQFLDPLPYYDDLTEKGIVLSDMGYNLAALYNAARGLKFSDTGYNRFVLSLILEKSKRFLQ